MEFFHRAEGRPARLGIFPGTFNPVTVAHMGLARSALRLVDEVVFVLPRAFPHKAYSGASFADRVAMLRAAASAPEPLSIAATEGGLFLEIARECRAAYGDDVKLGLLCGRDAAERAMSWDYDRPEAVPEMLGECELLVAARGGDYYPPEEWSGAISRLELPEDLQQVSATEVRRRIERGEPWEHLVPEAARALARRIY